MNHNKKFYILIFLIYLILLGTSFVSVSSSKDLASMDERGGRIINGQILFSPLYGTTTYLIDNTGKTNHTWSSTHTPGADVYWLGNGTILRTIRDPEYSQEGGAGGGVQKVEWDGTITWDFRYNTNGRLTHHDIKVLPNGNVLMIAWETKTRTDAIAAGRNPNTITGNSFMPDHVIEVEPTGQTTGDIVWEWHAWDHLIQDYDSSKDNYGVVGGHPELIDLNFGSFFMSNDDWLHTNSIDYNPEFDQILLSVHNFNEVWVIDHSTTTEEAVGHTGGNSGHGGDLLYRWGNPRAYRAGTASDQQLFGQHGTSWIKPSYPGAGDILIFNNGLNRPGGQYSSIDEIAPPVDANGSYYLAPGFAYGPENLTWRYTASPPTSFYDYYCSGADRLKDGDTLICDGVAGKFFEVTPDGTTVWYWTNPYPSPSMNDVFKIDYIPPPEPPEQPHNNTSNLQCEGDINWTNISPGETVHGSFQVKNIGDPNSTLNWTVDSSPDWGTWSFTPMSGEDLTPVEGATTVQVSVTAPNQKNKEFQGFIRVININNQSDFCLIPVYLKTPLDHDLPCQPFLARLFKVFPHAFPILRHLMGY
jgi:Arylsulfotransferase (ASST)